MAVYVDGMQAPYRNMVMCHMLADTTEELLEMATKIGVHVRYIQYAGTGKEHFDICLSKKAKAIKLGAKEATWHEAVTLFARTKIPTFKTDTEWKKILS